ncbi:nucleotide sugar dehydrogenase [Loktanella agnita]|uniref:nucleotide sugar dehydrogenase n=1 Tax=Loktanella agnita TaxID=287097 RepID=UPI003987E270
MKVVILGLGYVGSTAACCIASEGHQVIGVDVSAKKVDAINSGVMPILENGLDEMLSQALAVGLLSARTEIGDALQGADLAMVCVGTPSTPDGSHNMSFIADVSRQIAQVVKRDSLPRFTVAYRSTIRPGTTEELIAPIFRSILDAPAEDHVDIVYNPEFLREGSAIHDYFHPPKIVIGTVDGKPNAAMSMLNANIDASVFLTRYKEAEITKFVDNSWHAVKIAFANEVGRTCLNAGISAKKVHEIFVSDTKLNISPYYLRPGGAFGGSCLPKDVRALQYIGADTGSNLHLIDSLLRSNEAHKHMIFEHATRDVSAGAKLLLVGLAFKAGTDDLRESPNVDLARKILHAGYALDVFDPAVKADMLIGANLGYAFSQLPTLERLLVSNEHAQSTTYDRIIVANATSEQLELTGDTPLVDIGALQ